MSEVIRWYVDNAFQNYNHLIVSSVENIAVVVDPFDPLQAIEQAEKAQKKIVAILLTHEHFDHYQGAQELSKLTGAKIYAHISNQNDVPHMDIALEDGEIISFAEDMMLKVLATPGHIKGHICFYSEADSYLVCGDVIFNAGVGNVCAKSADVKALYHSLNQIVMLPGNTSIYPAHDYFQTNLAFSKNIDPENEIASTWLEKLDKQTPEIRSISTLQDELQYNLFLQVNEVSVVAKIAKKAGLSVLDSGLEAFKVLRVLRDKW